MSTPTTKKDKASKNPDMKTPELDIQRGVFCSGHMTCALRVDALLDELKNRLRRYRDGQQTDPGYDFHLGYLRAVQDLLHPVIMHFSSEMHRCLFGESGE